MPAVVVKPPSNEYITVNSCYMALCPNSACAAVLLSVFERWHHSRERAIQQEKARMKSDTDFVPTATYWIWKTYESFQEDCVIPYGKTAIAQALGELKARGFIDSRRNEKNPFDRTIQYRFNPEVVERAMGTRGCSKPIIDSPKTVDAQSRDGLSMASETNDEYIFSEDISKEDNSKESKLQPLSIETSSDETHVAPDLQLGDDIGLFISNAYSIRKRFPKPHWNNKAGRQLYERAVGLESRSGAEVFRSSLIGFLESDSDWLREKKWELRLFLDNPDKWLPDNFTPTAIPAKQVAPTVHPGMSSDPPPPQAPPSAPKRDFPAEWDAAFPDRPSRWGKNSSRDLLELAESDEEFVSGFGQILANCKLAIAAHPTDYGWLKFSWLLKKKDGTLNWYRILTEPEAYTWKFEGNGSGKEEDKLGKLIKKMEARI